jgi:hypothetical protein
VDAERRKRLLIIAAVACVAALLGDRLILSPLGSLWQSRRARIAQLAASVSKGQSLIENQQRLRQRWNSMQSESLPSEEQAAENLVLKSMARWVGESRLEVTSLKPRWTRSEKEGFTSLEFRANAKGSIGAISRFLYELETDPLALKVEEIEIAARDNAGEDLSLSLRFSGVALERRSQ